MNDASTQRRALTGPALTFLTGLDLERFGTEIWSRRPLLTSAADRADTVLFSVDDADELVSTRGLRTPFLRIAKDGEVLPNRRFVGGGGTGARIADQVQDDRVLTEFSNGATLVFQGLHRVWPSLQDLSGRLGDELGHPVQVNAYLTPTGSRGFSAHYDTHDVFVVQVAGRKSWRCFPPPVEAPLASQEWTTVRERVAEAAEGEPALAATLEPGDCLYLPRGWIHEATALGETSLHLTIGVHPVTRADVVRHAVDLALDSNVELRRSLAAGVDVGDPAQIAADLETAYAELTKALAAVDVADVADALVAQRWSDTRPCPIAPIGQAEAASSLTLDSRLALRGRSHPRLRAGDGHVHVGVSGRSVDLRDVDVTVLTALLDGDVVHVRQLADNADAALAAARTLLTTGIAVPA